MLGASVLAVAALVGGGCSAGDEPESGAPPGEMASMGHVHGIAAGPAGTTFIATHDGLYRTERDGRPPELVGDSRQDLMGFTRAGRGRYLASGHPDPRETGMPPDLGVIESGDQGRTWNGIAFYGAADFHVVEARGDYIYGYDGRSGTLKTTSDGRRWRQRVPLDEIFSLALDPRDPTRLVAASPNGVAASNDAGAKWRPLQPDLAGLLSWPVASRLFLIDGSGSIHLSRDGGRDWRTVGELGQAPTAFEAIGADLYAALRDGSVRRSSDDGATWSVVAKF